jgi:alkylation response protein AidB-like acyl-CoA dehydrogenase
MAGLGWMGLVLPADYGGEGMAFLDLAVLIEELGRALVPGPYLSTVVYCGFPILEAGTDEQKKDLLPKIAKGELIATLALTEPSASWEPSGVETRAVAEGDDFLISGTKLFISDAHVADCLLCVARTKDGADAADGITLFLVDAKSPGITLTPLKTIGSDKQFEVVFDKVRVPRKNVLGQVDRGWDVVKAMLPRAIMAQCAHMVGGAQQVLEMTVAYAKERVQFGKPIAMNQAIQFMIADMAAKVELARLIVYKSAWLVDRGDRPTFSAAIAKLYASDIAMEVTTDAVQIYGGYGYMREYPVEKLMRDAKLMQIYEGTNQIQRMVIAREVLMGG